MGTICTPAYANIFMASFELKFKYTYIKVKRFLLRFIDDLFMIWTGLEVDLLKFIKGATKLYFTRVIRNVKIVWNVVWIENYLRLNLSSRRY